MLIFLCVLCLFGFASVFFLYSLLRDLRDDILDLEKYIRFALKVKRKRGNKCAKN